MLCDNALHTSYGSLLGSINWLQSRELSFKHVISSLAGLLHPQHQPSVTARS